MQAYFLRSFAASTGSLSSRDITAARELVAAKYATPAWINRLP
jgi:hypothetical protein